MRKLLLAGAVLAISVGAAHAAPIAPGSQINVVGTLKNFDASTVTFKEGPGSVLTASGDFAPLAGCAGCATMIPVLTYTPFTPGKVYSITDGALTATLDVVSAVSASETAKTVNIIDNVILTMTGFDPTSGEWVFTGNHLAGKFTGSWSSTAEAVPEPASLVLFGTGLVVLGMTYRRRRA